MTHDLFTYAEALQVEEQVSRAMAEHGPRILVCGSRAWRSVEVIRSALSTTRASLVIHGGARGADTIAGIAATELGIDVRVFKADWQGYGKRAGFIRNAHMLEAKPDLVLAFAAPCLQQSKGTAHMVSLARRAGVRVRVIESHHEEFCL